MNILSLLSFTVFIFFMILSVNNIIRGSKNLLVIISLLTTLSLSIWSLFYTFIYTAPSPEAAFFFHRIGSIGWSLLPAFLCHLLLIMSRKKTFLSTSCKVILFYTLPFIILIKNIFSSSSCVALSFVESPLGWGYAYNNDFSNIWTYIYMLYISIYLGGALIQVFYWQNHFDQNKGRKQNIFIFAIIGLILILGFSSDLILPLFTSLIPPVANIMLLVFTISFYLLSGKLEIFKFLGTSISDTIFNTIMDPVILLDENYKIIKKNDATRTILNYDKNALLGTSIWSLFCQKSDAIHIKSELERIKKIENQIANFQTAKGNFLNVNLSATQLVDLEHGFQGFVLTFHDITLRKKTADALIKSKEKYQKKADELFKLANFDELTQLPNRRYFFNHLANLQEEFNSVQKDFGLIYMDLNGFKNVNDSFGHDVGDLVLIEAANRLKSEKSADEFLCRIGGDEFTLIIPNIQSELEIKIRLKKLKEFFYQPFNINGLSPDLSLAAGYALFSRSENNLDIFIHRADQKMYLDKQLIKGKDFKDQ